MVFILIVAIGGMDWVSRVELGLLALLIIAQLDFAIGAFLNPSDVKKAKAKGSQKWAMRLHIL